MLLSCLFETRDKSDLGYHRLPWKEPDAPHLLQVLYEDDDMVSLRITNLISRLYSVTYMVFFSFLSVVFWLSSYYCLLSL